MELKIQNTNFLRNWQLNLKSSQPQQTSNSFEKLMKTSMDKTVFDETEREEVLQKAFDQLSDASKNALRRIKNGINDISCEEWNSLANELKDLGLLTQADINHIKAETYMIPVGYIGPDGEIVYYPRTEEIERRLHGEEDWSGNPLERINSWINALYDWRSFLSRQTEPDGSKTYTDLSPITTEINSCQKVVDLIYNLLDSCH